MFVYKGKPIFLMHIAASIFITILLSCGAPTQNKNKNIIGPAPSTTPRPAPTIPTEVIVKPSIPEGAVSANYISDKTPLYAYVEKVDRRNGVTVIAFENNRLPKIVLQETYGAKVSSLRFDEFDRDLLLLETKLKDPVFTKYYLYVYRNNSWKRVVNGFSIHEDNNPESLEPIVVDPNNPNNMKRYYSVFDLDETSSLGYTWRLLQESIPIQNR